VSEHPNAARAREGFARFVQGDLPALVDLFADGAVWHVPGSMELSGAHHGRESIVAFLRRTAELTGGTYRVELLWTVADDRHLAAVYRARGSRPDGRELDVEQALLVELDGGGRWRVVRAQPLDQAAFDAFWND
jgi:ketosteroid isomerase-like protein